jgi:CRISPR-associated protein Csn2
MRLYFEPGNLEMEMHEGSVNGISFENPAMFREFTENLWNQFNGEEGKIFLTKGNKQIKLNKEGSVIFNPYSIDVNDRKILNHIYEEMQEIAEQDCYVKKTEINAAIISLLDELEGRLPYPLEYSLELDFSQLLKLYGVKIETQCSELLERMIDYMRLLHQTLGVDLFVFVHLNDYFSVEEIEKLEEMIRYEQIFLLIVENKVCVEEFQNQKWWIIDKDSCIIEI